MTHVCYLHTLETQHDLKQAVAEWLRTRDTSTRTCEENIATISMALVSCVRFGEIHQLRQIDLVHHLHLMLSWNALHSTILFVHEASREALLICALPGSEAA